MKTISARRNVDLVFTAAIPTPLLLSSDQILRATQSRNVMWHLVVVKGVLFFIRVLLARTI